MRSRKLLYWRLEYPAGIDALPLRPRGQPICERLADAVHLNSRPDCRRNLNEPRELLLGSLLLHPGRNVARTVKHAPNVDAVLNFQVKHEVRETPERPGAQARQAQFDGKA